MEKLSFTHSVATEMVGHWLGELSQLLVQLDPKIVPRPIQITNPEFTELYPLIEPHAKQLVLLLESQSLDDAQLQSFNACYQWLNFCNEIYEAFVHDPATMAQKPEFIYLEHALYDETQNKEVDHFLSYIWNQLMPHSNLSHAQCYAILCHTIGPNTKCARGFIHEIAKELTETVTPAVNYEYLMSHYPEQMQAFMHRNAIVNYYQRYWYDKGKDPEKLKKLIKEDSLAAPKRP